MGVTQRDLMTLADLRVREAEVLAEASQYSGAFYLLGYAVELALKARIAEGFQAVTIPHIDEVRTVFTHNVDDLVRRAGLAADRTSRIKDDAGFEQAWTVVRNWSPDARYRMCDRDDYALLHWSVTDSQSGVLTWIRIFWPSFPA